MNILEKIFFVTASNIEAVVIAGIFFALGWQRLLLKRQPARSTIFFTIGFVVLFFYGGFLSWLSGLGGDSFLEINRFSLREAGFWASGFVTTAPQMLAPLNKATILLITQSFVLSALVFSVIRRWPGTILAARFFAFIGVGYLTYLGHDAFSSGRRYIQQLQSQFQGVPEKFTTEEEIDLFVYIGESTSTLHMSLYGYPYKTTPRLEELRNDDNGFIVFNSIRSTHTHTSPSLLRALSLTSRNDETGHRHSVGVGGVLKSAGIRAKLYSVQPVTGSFAAFSRFVFEGADFNLPIKSNYKGNFVSSTLKDHQLLATALQEKGVVFFHSYAGHGPYLDHVDIGFSSKVETPSVSPHGLIGSGFSKMTNHDIVQNFHDYNHAIAYIDRNVAQAAESVMKRGKPAALMYFSDHGESVLTGRGHDSSRFIDEMTSVPLIIHFNEAYRKKYRDTFDRYRRAAATNRTKLLDQVTPTILDILFVRSTKDLEMPTFASEEPHPYPFILERDTLSGMSRIRVQFSADEKFAIEPFLAAILTLHIYQF
jgi:glucan phosphoethanolaminetransferase (alkaline phosphatase superfamily)